MRHGRILHAPRSNIDEDALDRARRLGTNSPSAAVDAALREAVRRAELEGFDALRDIELDLDSDRLGEWRDRRA